MSFNCYFTSLIGFGLLSASFFVNSIKNNDIEKFKKILPKELLTKYLKITKNRLNIYYQGLIIGIIISYFLLRNANITSKYHKISLFLAITLLINLFYYLIIPKCDYMKNHLKTDEEFKLYYKIHNQMKHRYITGFIIGILATIPFSISLCQ